MARRKTIKPDTPPPDHRPETASGSGDTAKNPAELPPGIRIDKWLFFARFFKTRTLASAFAGAGHIRLSRDETVERITKPKALVRPGDQLSFMRGERIFFVEVLACGERRGPAKEAALLYADHSPPPPPRKAKAEGPAAREPGSGRPTKKDRRAVDQLRQL